MRNEFARKTRSAAWGRANGQCEGIVSVESGKYFCDRYTLQTFAGKDRDRFKRCTAPIDLGGFFYDHIDPDWFSGCNDLDNCQVLCDQCNKEKTAKDQGNIAKVKRIRDKRIKAKSSRTPMPFGRNDPRKRKMDGTIVDRRTGKPIR